MTLKQLGIRKLGLNDIIRVGDIQLVKGGNASIYHSFGDLVSCLPVVKEGEFWVGRQICEQEIQDFANDFYRKLNVTN
jgi:hypothetical protein